MPVHCTLYPIRNVVRDWTTDLPISGRCTAAHNILLFLQVRKYKDSFPGKKYLKEQNSLWNFPLMTCLFQGDLLFTRACVMSLLAKMLVRIFMNMLIKWRSNEIKWTSYVFLFTATFQTLSACVYAHEHYVCVNACSPVDVEKDPRWRNWQKTELFFFSSPGRRLFSRPVSQFFHSNLKVITAHLKKRHLSQLCKSQQPDTFDRFVEDTCKL